MEPLAVDLKQAAALVSVSVHTLRRYVRQGKLRGTRIGRRVVIPLAELRRIVEITAKPVVTVVTDFQGER